MRFAWGKGPEDQALVETEITADGGESDGYNPGLHGIEYCDPRHSRNDCDCPPAGQCGVSNCLGKSSFFRIVVKTRRLRVDLRKFDCGCPWRKQRRRNRLRRLHFIGRQWETDLGGKVGEGKEFKEEFPTCSGTVRDSE